LDVNAPHFFSSSGLRATEFDGNLCTMDYCGDSIFPGKFRREKIGRNVENHRNWCCIGLAVNTLLGREEHRIIFQILPGLVNAFGRTASEANISSAKLILNASKDEFNRKVTVSPAYLVE
jgi:hypothetical protein